MPKEGVSWLTSAGSRKQKRAVVKVYPDYCSTGLWLDDCNVDPADLGIDDFAILLALRYWHLHWETFLVGKHATEHACKTWLKDGKKITQMLNANFGTDYKFVFDATMEDCFPT